MEDSVQLEQMAYQHIKQDNKAAAVKILLELIGSYARDRNFKKAESLRERLIQISPLAIGEIESSARVIEQEKREAIPQEHLDMWADLFNTLTIKEGIALYYAMKDASYSGEQQIFTQGEKNSNLFFIIQGQLRMLYNKGGKDVFLKMLRPGEIAGEDTFFSDSVCTTTVKPFSHAKLRYLEKEILLQWKENLPDLESKIHTYCLKFEKPTDLLYKRGLSRRSEARFKIEGKANVQLLSVLGVPAGKPFILDVTDISATGLSGTVRFSSKESARLFLGWNVSLKLVVETEGFTRTMDQSGTVVAVRSDTTEEYSVHIKFDTALDKSFVMKLELALRDSSWML